MDTNAFRAAGESSTPLVVHLWPWGVLTVVAALLAAVVFQRIAGGLALRPLWSAADAHWTERARRAYPGWVSLVYGQLFQPLIWMVVVGAVATRHFAGLIPLVGLAAFVGAGWVSVRLESRARGWTVTMLDWLRTWAVQVLFFLAPFVVFVCLLAGLPREFNLTALAGIAAAVVVVLILNLGGSLALARWTGLLRPAPERLRAIADQAAERMGVVRPRAYVLRWRVANALAFPLGGAIAVTDLALDSFSDEELTAICAHELAHLSEPRRVHLARVAGQFAWMPIFLSGPLCGALGSGAGLAVAFGGAFVAHRLVRRMSLVMEKRADSAGKAHEGEAGTYARALEKLYEINLMPAVTRERRPTHPHLYDRLLASAVTPAYARPEPPSRWRGKVAVGCLVLMSAFSALLWMGMMQAARGSVETDSGQLPRSGAVTTPAHR